MKTLTIEGAEIHAVSPEGASASMPLTDFFETIAGRPPDARSPMLPDGIKAVASRGAIEIWVHQSSPQAYRLQWIAADSPEPYGKGTTYRTVRIALPYLITIAVFTPGKTGKPTLSGSNECFFSNAPLGDWNDPLFYPALLNCSKFAPPEGKPLSWICTQHLDRKFDAEPDRHRRYRLGFGALLHCLLETGFNYSSEHHEETSWYTQSRTIDPRIATVEAWEEATTDNPFFALDVPWLPTGLNLGQVIDRIFSIQQTSAPDLGNAEALTQLVFKHLKPQPKETVPDVTSPFASIADLFDDIPL